MNTRQLTRYGAVAALYVALAWALPEFSYGPIQFRLSEILNLLAFYQPGYIIPITLGCAISNLFSPFGILDIVGGSLHTFLALYFMSRCKKDYIGALMPALFSPIIGLVIYIATQTEVNFWLVTGSVALSELVIVLAVSMLVYRMLMKRSEVRKLIQLENSVR